jgi:hypothetical protein
MPRQQKPETEAEAGERTEKKARKLYDASHEEGEALDAMVRKSINLHGA